MILTRRQMFWAGGGLVAAFALPRKQALADSAFDVRMQGSADGSHVWFDPVGFRIEPGQTVRWTNTDPGNSHTTTAYHSDLFGRPRRIPAKATSWNSDYLLPNQSFSVTLTVQGVYDFYCIPHEEAGMVGRIVVGDPSANDWDMTAQQDAGTDGALPEIALKNFPSVEEIMQKAIVRHA